MLIRRVLCEVVAASLRAAVIEMAARLQYGRIALAHEGLGGRGVLLEQSKIADVVPMSVRRGDDPDVAGLETERFDVRLPALIDWVLHTDHPSRG